MTAAQPTRAPSRSSTEGGAEAGPRFPTGRSRLNLPAAWPARRLVAAGALFPVLLALQITAGGGWAPGERFGWTALVVAVAAASAATLATYVPRAGSLTRLDLGCSPCAAVAALSVLAATAVLSTAPHDVPTAILALGAAGFGLRQRLVNAGACPTPNARA